jgi:hypothetical protein
MKKLGAQAGMGLLVAGLLGTAMAAPTGMTGGASKSAKMTTKTTTMTKSGSMKKSSNMSQVTGTVISRTATTLTIKPVQSGKMGSTKMMTVPSSAKVWMGKKTGKLSSLKPGQKVTVMMSHGDVTGIKVLPARSMKRA